MFIERFEDKGLAQYAYAIGCPGAGKMAVIDPRRDIDVFIDYAKAQGLEIAFVLETHIHADFASGARELAERTGAELWLSDYDTGETFEVQFPHRPMRDGDTVAFGAVKIQAMHTPGHTPEHLSFLVYDTNRSADVPMLFLTGDFLFVGSLGRPDLLGEDAKRALAHRQYQSVQRLRDLPDGLEIHPAHGAGSMCGAGIGGRPVSTLGYERIANPFLDPRLTEAQFVETLLATVPPFPEYYKRMKRVNAEGPRVLGGLPGMTPMPVERFKQAVDAGAVVIDLRDQLGFGAGHIPGAFGIGAGEKVSMWASWVVPYDTPILLVSGGASADVELAVRNLVRVGLDTVEGYLDGGMTAWIEAGLPLRETPQITPRDLSARLAQGTIQLLDVREDNEWAEGHAAGATHIIAGHVGAKLSQVPNGTRPLAVMCGSGYRSTVAASVLERAGRDDVVNVTGGMTAWRMAGLPTVKGGPS